MDERFLGTKEIIKKIIIAIIFVFLFNFLFANLGNNIVFADETAAGEVMDDEEIMNTEGGGKFLLPLHALVLFLADAVLELMQNNFISQQPVTIKATSEDTKKVNGWAIFGIVLGAVVAVAACVVTCRCSCSSYWSRKSCSSSYYCWCSWWNNCRWGTCYPVEQQQLLLCVQMI